MSKQRVAECEVAVIGAGLAGMAAALFAASRGLAVIQVGGTGGIVFSSGFFDLLGIYPVEQGRHWEDPWAAIELLKDGLPGHPLAHIPPEDIRAALAEFLGFLGKAGLPYAGFNDRNADLVTLLGTVKPTYTAPVTMRHGAVAVREKRPCLFVDFHGLKEFNANLLVDNLKSRVPDIRAVRLSFPGTGSGTRLFTRHLAEQLESEGVQERLASLIRAEVKSGEFVGLPAVLGMRRSGEILERVGQMTGAPLFEVPTLPASVPGLRLKETFEGHLAARGVQPFWQHRVCGVRYPGDGLFSLSLEDGSTPQEIRARAVVLATGRFFGKGLYADRMRVRETLFNLPVYQPESRAQWHHQDLLNPLGHPVNQAGLETDCCMRPLGPSGEPAFPALFASGSILAHHDWMRMKSGAGVAIAASYAAIKAFCEQRG
jgi:glycerol-3-phosphate dehydrogenase subunit B